MEPQQLTLWPDDALPGQLPLFNRTAKVGVLPEDASPYCERCEGVLLDFLNSRSLLPKPAPCAAKPMWEPDVWFGKRPSMDVIRAAPAYL